MSSTDNEIQSQVETYGFAIDKRPQAVYASAYGTKSLELAHILRIIEVESSKENIPPHVLFQLVRSFFKATKSEDPLAFHQDLARRVLKNEYKEKLIDPALIDLLAREVSECFNAIGEKIFPIEWIKDAEESLNKASKNNGEEDSVLNIIQMDTPVADEGCFTEKGAFKPIDVYLKFIEQTGVIGKEQAKKIKMKAIGAVSNFWFLTHEKTKEKHFYHSPAFLGFTRILWEDVVKKRVVFNEKFPPNTVKPIFTRLTSLMNAKKDNSSTPDIINLIHGTEVVGKIEIPLVPTVLHDKVFRGVGNLNTVVGHKMLRYAVSLPFEQKLQGIADFRVKEYKGGFVELGDEMGISPKKTLAELREILYALKHLEVPNIKESRITKGRLIDVTHFRSPKTGREDGLILTVLPTLVGYGEFDCRGMLLIPMATLPPPVQGVAARPFHAALYHLQMLLLEEFSEKSKELYQHKCIQLNDDDWLRLLVKANMPVKYKDRILSGRTVDGSDAPKVLERTETNHYILGTSYEKATKFLMDQGKIRIKQSEKGKASAQKRRNSKKG